MSVKIHVCNPLTHHKAVTPQNQTHRYHAYHIRHKSIVTTSPIPTMTLPPCHIKTHSPSHLAILSHSSPQLITQQSCATKACSPNSSAASLPTITTIPTTMAPPPQPHPHPHPPIQPQPHPHQPNQQPHPNPNTTNPYPPPPPNPHHPGHAYRTRPNAGPWELLRVEQIRGGVMIPQTYDYAKGPRPDGTRTWQANWEGRQTAEFGAVGVGKGIL